MMLHLSFAFAIALLSVSVTSSVFNGPRATSAIDDEVSFAHGWTPRPTSGSVVRNINRHNARNVLTELWAPDNVCGYWQNSSTWSWPCPTTATCVFFPPATDTFDFIGCGTSGTVLNSATGCVDYFQYLPSSSLYDQADDILKCTNSASPYCNTIEFPELRVETYFCEGISRSTTLLYYTDYAGDPNTRQLVELGITLTTTSSTTSTTSTSSTPSTSSPSLTPHSSSSTSVNPSFPLSVSTSSPTGKSRTGAIVGSVVGAVAAVVAVAVGTFVYLKKRKQKRFDNSIPEVAQM